jgi:very-short-patch-repair endonuclease
LKGMQRKIPLRAQGTLDNRLWARLRALDGTRFRRRSPFRSFILDFVEHEARLVISLEDSAPGKRSSHIVRDRLLNEQGYVILRLWRHEAAQDLHGAIYRIKAVLDDIAASGPA